MRALVIMAALVLVACQQATEEDTSEPQRAVGHLGSSAYYLERIAMPEGSYLEVLLVEVSGSAERVVGRTEVAEATAPPFEFVVDYSPNAVTLEKEHELRLSLYLPDGHTRFTATVSVDLSQPGVEAIRMYAVEPDDEAAAERVPGAVSEADDGQGGLPSRQSWQCGEILLDIEYMEQRALLILPWRDLRVEKVPADVGTLYSRQSTEFHIHGEGEATLELPGEDTVACTPSERRSPWARAREHGVWLRGVGNEPGWVLELSEGERPELYLVLDYGERELEFHNVDILDDFSGLVAESPGNIVEAVFIPEPCVDTMVGWEFPLRIEMVINEITLVGCGRFLE